MALCDTCDENWLVESCSLRNGRVNTVLTPLSMRFDIGLNSFTDGALTLATRDVRMRDIWPGLTSIYISRVTGIGASRETPVCEFAGIVTDVGVSESGATVVGMKSIDWYTTRRNIRRDLVLTDRPQTVIGENLVREVFETYAGLSPIPLHSRSEPSPILRTRTYEGWRRKNIGEAIVDLSQVENGPDWEVAHHRDTDQWLSWASTVVFRDHVGEDRGILIRSDIEASAYSISVDMENLATLVDAFGTGEAELQLIETAVQAGSIYPEMDAAPVWNDVSRRSTLYSHARGYLIANREPNALPTVTIPGLDIDPSTLKIGDTITVDIGYGAIRFNGQARVITIAWEVGNEAPEFRTLELMPLIPASQSIFNQPDADIDCEEC